MMGLRTQQITVGAAAAELQRTQMLLTQQGRTEQAQEVGEALQGLRQGAGDVEKTLIGAIVDHHLASRATGEAARLRAHIEELEVTRHQLENTSVTLRQALASADAEHRGLYGAPPGRALII